MSKIQIFFLYADQCKDCEKAKEILGKAIQESGIECEVKMFNCESRVAVNIAVTNGIDDIPACVVGQGAGIFQGKGFITDDIIKAIKKAAK